MSFPENLLYTKDHEWIRTESSGEVTVGITSHAQEALGDIVFVDLPTTGRKLVAHETFGVVESIKAVSDLYTPIAGEVVATNADAVSDPSAINREPYAAGWLIRLRVSDKSQLDTLLKPDAYQKLVSALK